MLELGVGDRIGPSALGASSGNTSRGSGNSRSAIGYRTSTITPATAKPMSVPSVRSVPGPTNHAVFVNSSPTAAPMSQGVKARQFSPPVNQYRPPRSPRLNTWRSSVR